MSYKRGQEKLKRRKRSSAKATFDANKEINVAVKTGKVLIGAKKVLSEVATGSLQLIIVAKNTPSEIMDQLNILNNCLESPIPVYTSSNSSWDLGSVCGKPFWISTIGILDAGDSSILKSVE